MEIKPPGKILPTGPGQTPRADPGPAALRALTTNWQVGQLFEAVVTGSTQRGHLLLSLRGVSLEVARPPDLPFQTGQRVQLQLTAREPLPAFRVLGLIDPVPAGKTAPLTVQQALRAEVPRQQPLPPLLANLAAVARPAANAPPLPADVQQTVTRLLQRLPTLEQIRQPEGLRQALQQSGPFLEARLARAVNGAPLRVDSDLHAALLRLADSLRRHLPAERLPPSLARPATAAAPPPPAMPAGSPGRAYQAGQPAPPVPHGAVRQAPQPQGRETASLLTAVSQENALEELVRQVDGALARHHVQQLHGQHAEQQQRQMWAMELPLRNGEEIDLFDIRIERDAQGRRPHPGPMPWSVSLAFDLAGLGPVRAVVSLRNEHISTAFWAEREPTASLFNAWLDTLRSQLAALGVEVGRLECHCGRPPEPDQAREPVLVDEQA
jgi:hypothetical protein